MSIKVNVIATTGAGKTTVSRIIENALRDAGFEVTNADPDVSRQTGFEKATEALSQRHSVEIVTTQAQRSSAVNG